jgi:hypothetical protein
MKITLKNFIGGLVPDWVTKPGESPTIRSQEYLNDNRAISMSNINPFTDPGKIQPGFQFTDIDSGDAAQVTTAITGIASGVHNGNYAAYGIGEDKLYKIIGAASNYNDIVNNSPTTPTWPHTISNVNTSYRHDCIVTPLKISGAWVLCLLYAYNLSTTPGAGRLGRFDIKNDSNWGSGNSSDTAYTLTTNDVLDNDNSLYCDRPIVKGSDGKIYIASGYVVDSLNTNDNSPTLNTNVVDIPRDFRIKSLAWYRGRLVIVAFKPTDSNLSTGQVGVFIWDPTNTTSFDDEYYIEADRVGAAWATANDLYIFTIRNTIGELRRFDGQDFEPITEIGTAIPEHGSVTSFRDGMAWGASEKVFVFASVRKNAGKSLWQTSSAAGTISAIRRLTPNNDILHVCGRDGSTEYIRRTDLSKYVDSASYEFVSIDLPQRSTWERTHAFFPALATGASMTISHKSNYGTGSTSYDTVTEASDGAVTRKTVSEHKVKDLDELRPLVSWSGTNAANQVKLARLELDISTSDTKQQA